MTINLYGKIALVTGANRGIGQALVMELEQRGVSRVYATYRSAADAPAASARLIPIPLDVRDPQSIAALAASVTDLDLLFNNAGIATGCQFDSEHSLEIAIAEMATHYFGPLQLTCALLPQLKQSSSAAIINLSSIAGLSNFPNLAPYSASKAATHSFTQGLRAELRSSGILVQGVYPGPVDTRMAAGAEMAKARPSDVAKAILDALEQGVEEVFPDAFSQQMHLLYASNPRALEQQFAQFVG